MTRAADRAAPAGVVPDIGEAMALHRQGRLSDAESIYAAILAVDPGRADALHLLGLAKFQRGHLPEALRLISAALKADPRSADMHANCGLVLDSLRQHAEALASFERALALKPDHGQALSNRAVTLSALGRNSEALASWDAALAIDPNHVEALHGRGNALYRLKRPGAALADYDRLLVLRPDNIDVLNNRGGALSELGRLDEAFASYARASALDPNIPEILINLGQICADRHQFEEALSYYAQGAAQPKLRPEAEWYASLVRLRLGDFARGWRDYEWRWQQASWAPQRRNFAAPLWIGQVPIAGKTILLHAEQGFGDTLQFVRYTKLVAAMGATVLLEVHAPLQQLVAGNVGATRIFARGEALPAFDLHCPLMSLPLALGTTLETVPATVPYLQAPQERMAHWRARLGEQRSLRVGVAWAGSATHKNNHNRSIALARFASLLGVPGVTFVSLQSEVDAADRAILARNACVTDVGPELRDFADTAAVISQLDLVIAVDTAVVHLAGALGKAVWVLLPFTPDFRWLLEREDSPWYPTMRLFRRSRFDDWESVLARVKRELERLAGAPN